MRPYDGPCADPWDDEGWVAAVADPEFSFWKDERGAAFDWPPEKEERHEQEDDE